MLAAAALAAATLAAGSAPGDDPLSRALLERAQREDAFTLGVQHSLERARAGTLGTRERLELDARQHAQRERQDVLFDRQQIRSYAPASAPLRHAETLRAEQAREDQLSRFRFDAIAAPATRLPSASAPAPFLSPTIVAAPIPRTPVDSASGVVRARAGESEAR